MKEHAKAQKGCAKAEEEIWESSQRREGCRGADGEDRIGDLVCRFKYRQVPATDYGLGLDDILNLSEKELNQIVGLKKLATYRSDGGLVSCNAFGESDGKWF